MNRDHLVALAEHVVERDGESIPPLISITPRAMAHVPPRSPYLGVPSCVQFFRER